MKTHLYLKAEDSTFVLYIDFDNLKNYIKYKYDRVNFSADPNSEDWPEIDWSTVQMDLFNSNGYLKENFVQITGTKDVKNRVVKYLANNVLNMIDLSKYVSPAPATDYEGGTLVIRKNNNFDDLSKVLIEKIKQVYPSVEKRTVFNF